ncbi:homeodomain-interacting protein kinase 2 isoform X1 [Xyrichtys novacula]|uniref:Homeodomain-interacting protein kinase 2 isoform X1 n=1 Tax=Xyrichtys novacula TaxID=13765 RepID=A0AAV1HBC7_XYRNO|nr:homeodomain-interacting protein kinase 2 isoform X1 [Xyrichtys novacula]
MTMNKDYANILPSNYCLLKEAGRGCFGVVLKCLKVDTDDIVAIKVLRDTEEFRNEYDLMEFFKRNNLDEKNIVRYIEMIPLKDNIKGLVFEMLDETLWKHMTVTRSFDPLNLANVRSVIHQMATALDVLKTNKVIHSDIKPDNIMVVDSDEEPLQVKLIDFGLAFPTSSAVQGQRKQVLNFRAPEIILGQPFSEAIDMWSLGVVMAFMLTGYTLFPANLEYDALHSMIKVLGAPPNHVFDNGLRTRMYCKKTSGQWRLKTPYEYAQTDVWFIDSCHCPFESLDQLEKLTTLAGEDANEKKECINLLKAMLQMDPSKRITPSEVLAHPFITNAKQSSDSRGSSGFNEQTPRTPLLTLVKPNTQTPRKPLIIQVKPEPAEHSSISEEDSEEDLEPKRRPCLPRYFQDESDTEGETSEDRTVTSGDPVPVERRQVEKKTPRKPLIIQVKPKPPEFFMSSLSISEEDSEEDLEPKRRPCLPRYFQDESDTERRPGEKKEKKKGQNCVVRFGRWLRKKSCRFSNCVHSVN